MRWTVFKLRFCGFAAQKYSTKPQLKNCRLARRYAKKWSSVLFEYLSRSGIRCYLSNIISLGVYGACYVVARAEQVGKKSNVNRPGFKKSVLLTIITLGIYPAVMLSILAFDLGRVTGTNVGNKVLLFNVLSLITAVLSGGLLVVVSVLFWSYAFRQVILAENVAQKKIEIL
ncbi:MAG: DUF4234 domain-containing protein [Gammaproteobacteria bacterium]|nr:MAG: DUF4234 domain-containing protein [Gammaproteobacteria bacterium]